jgi:hypothetical protein
MTSQRQNFVQSGVARIALSACLILSFLALSVEPAPSQIIPNWNRNCKKLLRQYDKKPRHKAFAVSSATSSSMIQACAIVWSAPSKKAAEGAALRSCHQDGSGCVIRKSE